MNTLKACLSIFRIKTAEGFQYRMAGIAGASTSIFWVLIEITVYIIFFRYANRPEAGIQAGMTLQQVVSYAWLTQLFFMMQPMNIDSEILGKITSGDVAIELCRPLDLYSHWFAKVASSRLMPMFWRGSATLIFGILMPLPYGISAPASFEGFIMMLLSLLSAFLLCTAYAMLVNAVRLNITLGEGPTYIMMLMGGILSGAYLPLQLWPKAVQKLLFLQPFAGYLDIPLRFYIGTLEPNVGVYAIGLQLLWTAAFVIAGKALMSHRLKSIIVQGG
ncbi:MAG: ABC transporter permease [Bacillota bacterium]